MATYVIGDVQGCYAPLMALLEQIEFDRQRDILWCAGDLVNRGPESLAVLRFFKGLGDRGQAVLGNHDLHLLALAAGNDKHRKPQDTLDAVLAAPDRMDLVEWLRHRPYLLQDHGVTLIHAGLPPQWDLATAQACAAEAEAVLRGQKSDQYLRKHIFGKTPDTWRADLEGWERIRFITGCFTRLRYCTPEGGVAWKLKLDPDTYAEQSVHPWYEHPQRQTRDQRILFGHWSTLGLRQEHNIVALDTGCLWGGALTALRLEDGRIFQYDCPRTQDPGDFA